MRHIHELSPIILINGGVGNGGRNIVRCQMKGCDFETDVDDSNYSTPADLNAIAESGLRRKK